MDAVKRVTSVLELHDFDRFVKRKSDEVIACRPLEVYLVIVVSEDWQLFKSRKCL